MNIATPENTTTVVKRGFITSDIIDLILKEDGIAASENFDIPDHLYGKDGLETAKNVWRYVRQRVRYVEDDAEKYQDVKSAARTLQDGYGDCKSITITIITILRAMGFDDLFYRFTGHTDPETKEEDKNYTHVYVVWKPEGEEIPIDGTYNRFGQEVKYLFKMDKKFKPQLRHLRGTHQSGIGNTNTNQFLKYAAIGGLLYWLIY